MDKRHTDEAVCRAARHDILHFHGRNSATSACIPPRGIPSRPLVLTFVFSPLSPTKLDPDDSSRPVTRFGPAVFILITPTSRTTSHGSPPVDLDEQ